MPTPTARVRSPASTCFRRANLSFTGTPSGLAWNVPAVLANYFQPIVPSTTASYLVGKTGEGTEKQTTAYVIANLNHDFSADITLRGNVGVQVIHTQQKFNCELDALRGRGDAGHRRRNL